MGQLAEKIMTLPSPIVRKNVENEVEEEVHFSTQPYHQRDIAFLSLRTKSFLFASLYRTRSSHFRSDFDEEE